MIFQWSCLVTEILNPPKNSMFQAAIGRCVLEAEPHYPNYFTVLAGA